VSRIGVGYKVISIYQYRHPRVKLLVESVIVAVTAYISALLTGEIRRDQSLGQPANLGLNFVAVVVVTAVVVFTVKLLRTGPDIEMQEKAKVLATARSQLDDCLSSELARIGSLSSGLASGITDPLTNIQNLVKGLYRCIDARYASSDVPGERTAFEVTFMSRDYTDGAVTILSWASREGRAPKSLAYRALRPSIYDSTITAALYREAESQLPRPRIIEDTSDANDYTELYAGQKNRIKSTVVYPVLSADNELLGTLVLHCDRQNFFRYRDERFWHELVEMFSLRIAIEKLRLDYLQSLNKP
jgi:GAF domain-containing protein